MSVTDEVDNAFRHGRFVTFEAGMDNSFSLEIERVVYRYGVAAVNAIARKLSEQQVSNETESEVLRCLARINDTATHDARMGLLINKLSHSDRWVRDGAALALDSMGDPVAIPALRKAVDDESIPDLKKDLMQVLDSLTQQASSDTSYANGERAAKLYIDGFKPVKLGEATVTTSSNVSIASVFSFYPVAVNGPEGRWLARVDTGGKVTYPDDLTLDEAKYAIEMLLRHPLHSAPAPQRVTLTSSQVST